MKHKRIALLLVFLWVLMLVPAAGQAEAERGVGGNLYRSELAAKSATLELDNRDVSGPIVISDNDFHIIIKGRNKISADRAAALYSNGSVTISAASPDASLSINTYEMQGFGINVNSLIINGGNINTICGILLQRGDFILNGGTADILSFGESPINTTGSVILNGGTLIVTYASESYMPAIRASEIVINGGRLYIDSVVNCECSRFVINSGYLLDGVYFEAGVLEPGDRLFYKIETVSALTTVGGKTDYYFTFDEAWQAAQNADGPVTVKLVNNAELTAPCAVAADRNITLDLNGHTLDASASTQQPGAFHVEAGGTFTLLDSSTTDVTGQGKITGANSQLADMEMLGGAVSVAYGGTFVMNGGVLTGNTASDGGGVYNEGTFVMNGGKIIDNHAYDGGGVFTSGTFALNGGRVIGNKAAVGGGVFHAGGNLSLQGNAVISGNVHADDADADNLYLDCDLEGGGENQVFTVGTMGENAKVYLTAKKPPDSTENPVTLSANVGVSAQSAAKFHSDNPAYCIQLWQDGVLYLNEHFYSMYQTEKTMVSQPTCTQDAIYAVSCESCGDRLDDRFTAEGTALGHSWVNGYLPENADADMHYDFCTRCGERRNGAPHEWNLPAATETESKHCTVCGYVAEAMAKHTHKGVLVPGSAATCTEMGAKSYYTCACGRFFKDGDCTEEIGNIGEWIPIPAPGHQWYDTLMEDNCDGDKHYLLCMACGELSLGEPHPWNVVTATLETPKYCMQCHYVAEAQLEHIHEGVLVARVPAGCGTDGVKAHYLCNCGMRFLDAACTQEIADFETWKVIPGQEHSWSEAYLQTDTEKHYHLCTRCGQPDTGETHIYLSEGNASCTVCGRAADASAANKPPRTGDDTHLLLFFLLLALSGAGAVCLTVRRKRAR